MYKWVKRKAYLNFILTQFWKLRHELFQRAGTESYSINTQLTRISIFPSFLPSFLPSFILYGRMDLRNPYYHTSLWTSFPQLSGLYWLTALTHGYGSTFINSWIYELLKWQSNSKLEYSKTCSVPFFVFVFCFLVSLLLFFVVFFL